MLRMMATSCWVKSTGKRIFLTATQASPAFHLGMTLILGLRRNDADKLSIVTNGADRVTVDAGGSVGIGVTSPRLQTCTFRTVLTAHSNNKLGLTANQQLS